MLPFLKQFSLQNRKRKSLYYHPYPTFPSLYYSAKQNKAYQQLLGEEGYQFFIGQLMQPEKQKGYKTGAWFLANIGLPDYAINLLEKCLEIEEEHEALVFYFQTLMFTSPELFNHDYLYKAYAKWGKTFSSGFSYTDYPNQLTSNRRLRIGYTCHFITNSTSSTLLLPLLKAHNRDRVEIFMYSDQDHKSISDEVRNLVEHWRDTDECDDEAFCKKIRDDKIDIILELNGHVIKNRYRALTAKPAPIQVSYYNHAATSGVPGIDYILLGEDINISHLQDYYSEKIFYKKGITLATVVSPHFPPVSPLPCLQNGYVTFGSFGQSHKVSLETIDLWCEILKRVPHSKLYFKTNVLDFPAYKSVYAKHFSDRGIDLARIILEGPSDYTTLLQAYSKIDIALDTYPYPAGTTTMEASISGVPVLSHTKMDGRLSAKIGYFNLNSIAHTELLSTSKDDYINKAVTLAGDIKRLKEYRHTLREDVIHSRRADMKRFIDELEVAYKEMWNNYLQEKTDVHTNIK